MQDIVAEMDVWEETDYQDYTLESFMGKVEGSKE